MNNQPPILNTGQQQKQQMSQRLIMSANMQQAIHLLQLPVQELEAFLEEQVVLNPILEMGEAQEDESDGEEEWNENTEAEVEINDRDLSILNRLEEDLKDHFSQTEAPNLKRNSEEDQLKTFLEQSISAELGLNEQLLIQAHDSFENREELAIAEVLIGYIDEFGFLTTPLAEICALHNFDHDVVIKILHEIQTFEPKGVGASSIQESLLIQLKALNKENTLAYEIVHHHYNDLLHNHFPQIQKKLKQPLEEIQKAVDEVAKLDLHPGRQFSNRPSQDIIPDVTLREENGKLVVDVERDRAPSLRLNLRYLDMLKESSTTNETKHFIKNHLFSARWLMRNLQQRYSTLERIAQSLAERQHDFFLKPEGKLVPLTMQTIAEELNVHESTVARIVANKYLYCPKGLFSLRDFFTTKYVSDEGEDLSSATVKQSIIDLIEKEDKQHPLSDEKLSALLKQKGISCARRTVAKYRTILQIASTTQRKKVQLIVALVEDLLSCLA